MTRAGRRAAVWLLVLAALIAFARLRTYTEPLERDVMVYAVAAHELNQGRHLYADVWDHKPPAVHVTWALGERVFGYGRQTVYALNVLAALATLLGVFAAAWAASGSRAAGLWAAAFWAVISGDLVLQANQPNTEVFLNACLTWSVALLLTPMRRWRKVVGVGLLWALASLFKTVAILVAAALALAHLAFPSTTRRRALGDVVIMAALGALAWLAVLGWFELRGTLGDFMDAVFLYNRAYTDSVLLNLVTGLMPHRAIRGISTLFPLILVLGFGLLVPPWRRPGRRVAILFAWAVGSILAIAAPGRFYPHYYQLWLPILAVVGASLIATVGQRFAGRLPRFVPIVGAVVLALLVWRQAPSYLLDSNEWSLRKYGDVFIEAEREAEQLEGLLEPGETFYVLGSEPNFYFVTGQSPPSGVFYSLPLLDGPLAEKLGERVLADLARVQPELIIVNTAEPPPRSDALKRFIEPPAYRSCGRHGRYEYLCRRGSSLGE